MSTCHAQSRPYVPRHWPRLPFAAALVTVALIAGALGFAQSAHAATIPVNTTTDEFNTGPNCSLREAIQSANTDTAFGGCAAGAGADTITLGSGTFQITINPGPDENANAAGDFDIASSITIQGAGAGSTFVDGGGVDRIFDVAPNGGPAISVGFSGLTLQNGKGLSTNFGAGGGMFINSNATVSISNSTLANNQSTTTVGGAIANRGTLTLNTVTLQNNTALALGGAVNSAASGGGGGLTVINSTFTGNKAESGGAVYISTDAGTNASITGSTFTGNQAVATSGGADDDGGAIAIDTDGAVNITESTFTGNSAPANGGAIFFNDSATQAAVAALTLSYNRIAGNTAVAGSGLFHASGTATAERNWWGCNSGPAAAPCNVVAGNADFTPWIVLTHTANPTTIGAGQGATLTAGFLKNSDGSTNAAGDLGALAGVPVTFGSAVLGTISGVQTTIQSNGAATATYTAGALPGAGSATATVDSATATANLTIIQSDTTPPDTTITASPSNPSNDTSPSFGFAGSDDQTLAGSLTFECALDDSAFAACPNPQTYSSLADGSHTFQVRAVDAAGNVDPTPASFTWTVDATPPSVTINQASEQADPTSASPIHFTVVFNEFVTGFGDGDVAISGTADATTAVVTEITPNNGTTYDVAVSGMTANGTVIVSVPAGSASDAASNFNTASTSTDNTVTFIANRPPVAVADSYSTNEDTTLNVAAPGVLANDTDQDGDTLAAVFISGPSHGSVTLNANGSFSYVPAANYSGSDSFSYKARDPQNADSSPVAVSITVNAVNDPPTVAVAAGGSCSSTSVSGTMNLTVGDVDSPNVTLTGSSSDSTLVPGAKIVLGGSGAGRTVTITAVPQKSSKRAVITITANDGNGATSPVTFNVIVGTDKKETINGTSSADMLFGLNGDDTINAGDGNDLACGGNGRGVISGGSGDDTLDGANGDDTLRGDGGNDILRGGAGSDRLEGGADDDTLTGGSGADFFSGGPGIDRATDFTPSEGDTQDATLETLSAAAVELTREIYLPVVSH